MYALSVQKLPEGKEWLHEVKFDGYRCLVGRDETGVTLWTRKENLFTKQFPQIAGACELQQGISSMINLRHYTPTMPKFSKNKFQKFLLVGTWERRGARRSEI